MIEVRATRSDALIEGIYDQNGWDVDHEPGYDMTKTVVLGPFEWVQLTYEHFRVSPEGGFVGEIVDGDWHLDGHEHPFSDLVVSSAS